jgi:hypothetical protein
MVMKCHGIPAEFVRGGFGKPRFVLAEDARALEIETQELAEALSNAIAWIEKGCVRSAHARLTDALANHRAKQ